MKIMTYLLATLGALFLLAIAPAGSASAQTAADIGKAIQQKLSAEVTKLENSCGDDIKKYCSDVTPGEGRMIYCMQAHEDKISPKCSFDLEEAATDVQMHADNLKEAIVACRAEITGVCGKTQPGQGRIAACLIANKSTASKSCVDALDKIEAMAH
jgi:Cysteine rich repeat